MIPLASGVNEEIERIASDYDFLDVPLPRYGEDATIEVNGVILNLNDLARTALREGLTEDEVNEIVRATNDDAD